MGKRNAHALAARQRKAGAHEEREQEVCTECGKPMGFRPPSLVCGPCDIFTRVDNYEESSLMELAVRWREENEK